MMIKILCLAALSCVTLAVPAFADEDVMYPVTTPYYPFQRSYLTGHATIVPPYRRPFPVRIYSTPQQQPYYNVQPYTVTAPY